MLLVHPILQLCAIICTAYALLMGLQRFRFRHMEQKVQFQWKRHVLFGKMGIGIFIVGLAGGASLAFMTWHKVLVTGLHGKIALTIFPLLIFSLFTGMYMDKVKKNPNTLALVHGVVNLIIFILALVQIYTGIWVYNNLVTSY